MSTHEALEVREDKQLALRSMESVQFLIARQRAVHSAMDEAMKEDTHFGKIPGAGDKKVLLKPGAEMLGALFRLRPEFRHEVTREDGHLTVVSLCSLFHIGTEDCLVRDVAAICSTHEKKYAVRKGGIVCPNCGVSAVKRNKRTDQVPNPGWQCIGKDQGGCWAKFAPDDSEIINQNAESVANPDLADAWNTVIKMADKRSLVAATLIATGASDMFTQDVEEQAEPTAKTSEQPPDESSEAKQDDGKPDPAAAIKLVQAIKKHPSYNQQKHGVPTRKDGVPKLQALLDSLEGKPAEATPETEAQSDPLDAVRDKIRNHARYKEEGGDDAYGEVLKTGDEESLNGLLAYLNGRANS